METEASIPYATKTGLVMRTLKLGNEREVMKSETGIINIVTQRSNT